VEIGPHPVTLAEDLRRGERQAFVRFYELYRVPIYNLVLTLTHGSGETPSIVRDVFITAYRQILLSAGPIQLTPWVYRVAVTACQDYLADGGAEADGDEPMDGAAAEEASAEEATAEEATVRTAAAEGAVIAAAGQWQDSDLSARFAQALDSLGDRHQAALLLTDVHGLQLDEIGLVFGLSRDGARSLLFRARESFRQAFADVSAQHAVPACRLAEQAAAASVGRSLGAEEERKLREHAGYCRPCRRTMKAWPLGVTGLALFLRDVPPPPALAAAPVFAAPASLPVAEAPKKAAAAGVVIPLNRALRRAGAAVTSKAAAYAVAAVCLAATIGMAVYVTGLESQPPGPGFLSAQRPAPHGVRHVGKAVVIPVGSGAGEATGQIDQLAATSGAPLPVETVAVATVGAALVSGAKQAGLPPAGGGSASGSTGGPQTGGATGAAGSRGTANAKGGDRTNPAGKAVGNGKADRPAKGAGKSGGNDKATKPPTKGKPVKESKPSKPSKSKASKPSKPKASKPKQAKQARKPSKTQK
jgi:RNA polymerase sigma factor (sigma-70 family)